MDGKNYEGRNFAVQEISTTSDHIIPIEGRSNLMTINQKPPGIAFWSFTIYIVISYP